MFAHAKPMGGRRMCAPGCQTPDVETHVAPAELTLRIDFVGQNGTTGVTLSFTVDWLQVSMVQVPRGVTTERKSLMVQ
jgi:hypothetical protein